jgi:hypothetical protein
MLIRTLYAIDDTVTAPDAPNGNAPAQFTVEAIRVDKRGVSYLLNGTPKEYPNHTSREWLREHEITAVMKGNER